MIFIKTRTLFNIASGGAVIVMGLGAYVIRRLENVYKDSAFFKDAMNIMQEHEGVSKYLGTDLSASRVKPEESEEASPVAAFTARVTGSKSSGQMYFWAERILEGDNVKIKIKRIELELDSDKSKRLLVKAEG